MKYYKLSRPNSGTHYFRVDGELIVRVVDEPILMGAMKMLSSGITTISVKHFETMKRNSRLAGGSKDLPHMEPCSEKQFNRALNFVKKKLKV